MPEPLAQLDGEGETLLSQLTPEMSSDDMEKLIQGVSLGDPEEQQPIEESPEDIKKPNTDDPEDAPEDNSDDSVNVDPGEEDEEKEPVETDSEPEPRQKTETNRELLDIIKSLVVQRNKPNDTPESIARPEPEEVFPSVDEQIVEMGKIGPLEYVRKYADKIIQKDREKNVVEMKAIRTDQAFETARGNPDFTRIESSVKKVLERYPNFNMGRNQQGNNASEVENLEAAYLMVKGLEALHKQRAQNKKDSKVQEKRTELKKKAASTPRQKPGVSSKSGSGKVNPMTSSLKDLERAINKGVL